MGYEVCKFGMLCLSHEGVPNIYPVPHNPRVKGNISGYNGKSEITIISLKGWDSHKITWIKPDGLPILIADRPLLVNISWDELEVNGFVRGKEFWIDGMPYRCRLVQVGPLFKPNEWDKALDATGSEDQAKKLWHTDIVWFWGSVPDTDEAYGKNAQRVLRGNLSSRTSNMMSGQHKSADVGFRPVLEPMPIRSLDPDKYIRLDGCDFLITQLSSKGVTDSDDLLDGYPILNPRNKETIHVLDNIPSGTECRMYTLLKDGKPVDMETQKPPVFSKGTVCTLTDKFFGEKYLIPWNIINGIAVAKRRLFKISV